jgi:hypothetical protein
MSSGAGARTRAATRAGATVQLHAGDNGPDRRQLEVVIGLPHLGLVGGGERRAAAGAARGEHLAHLVGGRGQRAGDAGAAWARAARLLRPALLLARRRRAGGVARGLGRETEAGLERAEPGLERGILLGKTALLLAQQPVLLDQR